MSVPNTFKIKSRIWINSENGTFLGEGRIELLKQIESTGSISKAAKAMKMSYKKAWELVSSMNTQFKEPLVVGSVGGLNGGGSALSDMGREIILLFTQLNEKNKQFLKNELDNIELFK
jgi:molybdate transport system regulatory protein